MRKLFVLIALFMLPATALGRNITMGEFLDQYTSLKHVPASSKYIDLNYRNFEKGSYEYQVLQKVVYLDLLPNLDINFPYYTQIDERAAGSMMKKFEGLDFNTTKGKKLTYEVLEAMLNFIDTHDSRNVDVNISRLYEVAQNTEFAILEDVYKKLIHTHIDNENIDKTELVQGAIKGMAEASGDDFTAYFPPVDSKNFIDRVNGSFVGIGAYVEMPKPGKFIITAPIEGSPAEKSGLRAGDQVILVDDFEITEDVSTEEAISRIKGEKGTEVVLTILRDNEKLVVPVIRDLIVVKAVTAEELDSNTLLIDINMFSESVYQEFVKALTEHKSASKSRIIIDLTDNPGGALEEVVKILDHFAPTGEPTVVTEDLTLEEIFIAKQVPDALWLGDKQIVIAINGGSASASEIMAGTISEYVKNSVLIGEKTYGKGSVQALVEYYDTSLLKITVAKWLTGKERRHIDKVGIEPDVFVEDDLDTELNEIMEKAKSYKFY